MVGQRQHLHERIKAQHQGLAEGLGTRAEPDGVQLAEDELEIADVVAGKQRAQRLV